MNKHTPQLDLESATALVPVPPKPDAKPADGEITDFDWNDSEAVVLPEQPETAVYWNPRGELVIRQRRWPDDDPVIYITPANLGTFLDRLTDICGVPSAGKR